MPLRESTSGHLRVTTKPTASPPLCCCSGPWGNNTHCFNNKGSHTLKTGKYYQDSDNEDRAVN